MPNETPEMIKAKCNQAGAFAIKLINKEMWIEYPGLAKWAQRFSKVRPRFISRLLMSPIVGYCRKKIQFEYVMGERGYPISVRIYSCGRVVDCVAVPYV